MKIQYSIFSLLLAVLLLFSGCSNVRHLQENEQLYVGSEINVHTDSLSTTDAKALKTYLKTQLRPKPNKKFLGLRLKLFFYNLAGEKKKENEKGLKKFLRTKLGEPPVLISTVNTQNNIDIIDNKLQNRGYFNVTTEGDTVKVKHKRVKAVYDTYPKQQYKVHNVHFTTDSTALGTAIRESSESTLLKKGEPYSLSKIKAERERIDKYLKEHGYYYFSPDYLIIRADSTVADHEVEQFVEIKNSLPERAREAYSINNIYIYPSYSLGRDSLLKQAEAIKYDRFYMIDPEKNYKPKIFEKTMFFDEGELYNRTDHNRALNRLTNIGTFKFVKNVFTPDTTTTAPDLNAFYYLTPNPKKSIQAELQGKTNSADYKGSEINFRFRNRNTFGGAELLTVSAFGGSETQVSGQNSGFGILRYGAETELTFPQLLSPFKYQPKGAFVPRTRIGIRAEQENRSQLYTLGTFTSQFGYVFKPNIKTEHKLNVMDISYVRPSSVTDLYNEQIAENPSLEDVVREQLIFGPSYEYKYTSTVDLEKKHRFYYNGKVDLAGNLTGLLTGADFDSPEGPEKIADVPFSQYFKIENDFRHYMSIGKNELASRIDVGFGLPYGNSREMPFIKQFFIGGVNSIRAFRARTVGPGSFREDVGTNDFLPDQSGDIKIEFNSEYRAKFNNIFEGALFVDAGNIWLLNENEDQPGAEISSDFLNEFAVGAGAGLRFDLVILVLRTDLAFPLRKPYLPDGERWVVNDIDFLSPDWRKENLVFNLAIGYPF